MRINGQINSLFTVIPATFSRIKDKVASLDKEWDINTFRQDTFYVHSETKSIVFKFQSMVEPVKNIDTYTEWNEWKDLLEPIMQQAAKTITGDDGGIVVKAMLAMIPAGCSIAPHMDAHWTFDRAHRVHLPIITNDMVDFTIGGDVHHLEEGAVYEINNKLQHSVKNRSDVDRVHLIFDYVSRDAWDEWDNTSQYLKKHLKHLN